MIQVYFFVNLEKLLRRTLFVILKWTVLMAVTNSTVVSIHQYCRTHMVQCVPCVFHRSVLGRIL